MSDSQFISVRETAQLLGITEKKVMDLIESKELQAYRIANQFLRLKRDEVLALRNSGDIKDEITEFPYTTAERLQDFLYFNDFYLVCMLLILGLLFFIFYR